MARRILYILLLLAPLVAHGQYYDQGASPASIRWRQIRTPHNRLIFPENYSQQAIRVMHYLDTVRVPVNYGYRHPALDMPIILHTQNFSSNGLVMRAPTRMELIVPPPAATTPEPWLKQLVTHESRHTVQYGNMDQHFIHKLTWLLGDQGALIGIALLPLWGMEGDAVLAETEMSNFGRGLQPSFTLAYRAMVGEKKDKYAIDKWFCGSYKDFMPDHYAIGYQITSYAYTKYGENVWDKVGDYATRYPYVIFTTKASMWKYYRTSVNRLCRETLEDLDNYWDSLPEQLNSARIIPTPVTAYTKYSSPLFLGDALTAVKEDFQRPARVVQVDPQTGKEKVLFHTGSLNSPLTYDGDGRLYWSELRRSKLWGERVSSQLCYADLSTGRTKSITGERQVLFPTPLPGGRLAFIEYRYDGSYAIKELGSDTPLAEFSLPESLHGLAWDETTGNLYYIAVTDNGMHIGSLAQNGEKGTVRHPAFATINDLRAQNGQLYFTSTQSGRDEAHAIDLATGVERQISTSQYGSFSPAPDRSGNVAMATYAKQGYLLSIQQDDATREVSFTKMPENVVNPQRKHWETPLNMDEVVVADTTSLEETHYRRIPHAVNVHSWAPVAFDPQGMMAEKNVDVNVGLSVMSQDLLSSTILTARYGYIPGKSIVGMNLRYNGLAPKFELSAEYGGGKQNAYNAPKTLDPKSLNEYFEIDGRVLLPLYFDHGYHYRLLQPTLSWQYTNGRLYNKDGSYTSGINKMVADIYFSDNVRMATRDLLPRWGYAARISAATDPTNSGFGTVWTGYARGYLPGVKINHSTMLRAAAQRQTSGRYHFRQKELFPKGADYNVTPQRYFAAAVDYQLPIAYPDWGITSIVYFKRIRLNLAGYCARYQLLPNSKGYAPWQTTYSYGGDIIIDTNLLRTPAPGTNYFRFSVYKPSDSKGVFFGFDFSLPI